MNLPFVSCVTPTFNRRKFLPYLLYMYSYQQYPINKRELIILDDSTETNKDIIDDFLSKNPNENIRYIYSKDRIKLGMKRNTLNELSKGDIIMAFDDDDYYPPEKIKYAVTKMNTHKVEISGSSEMYLYYTNTGLIYKCGPFSNTHCTNATVAYRRSYLKNRKYNDTADSAEEKAFLDNFENSILQLDTMKNILCICHDNNTVDKSRSIPNSQLTNLKLKDFVKDKKLYNFYLSLK